MLIPNFDINKINEQNIDFNKLTDNNGSKELEFNYEDKKRTEIVKIHFHKIFKIFIWIIFITFMLVFIIRIIHLVLPPYILWLDADQIQVIDKMLFSGVIGGLITKYFEKLNT